MQAVVFTEREHVEVQDAPAPPAGADEVVLRVGCAGICGTDVHIFRGEYMSDFPLVPGHEFVGTVESVGRGVRDPVPGQRVVADPNLSCGACTCCRDGLANHCLNWQGVGITRPGAFAERVVVPARACHAVPDTMSDGAAAFVEPVACVVHAINRLDLRAGETALIFGAGPMGLLLMQALRHRGAAAVTIVDTRPARLDLAGQLGATRAVPAEDLATLRDPGPHGFDVVVDATGVPAVVQAALDWLRPGGRYLQFGVTPRDATIQLRPYDLFRHDWVLLGTFALRGTFPQAIAWMNGGVIDVEPLISHRAPLAEFPKLFAAFARGQTLKVHVRPGTG